MSILVGTAYLAILAFLMFNETRLVYPAPHYPSGNWTPDHPQCEDVWFQAADGQRLNGWYLPHPQAKFHILVCHGNAVHVADVANGWAGKLGRELEASVFVFDYRGYGRNDGVPDEAGVIADGRAARDWLCQRAQLQPEKIVIYGSSLGGGVAVALCAEQTAQALVVDRTFDQMPRAAAVRYPWVPVSWLMRNRYDSLARIAHCRLPTFVSHFENDRVITYQQGRRLFDASPAAVKEFYGMPQGHHNAALPDGYWGALRNFLKQTSSQSVTEPETESEADPVEKSQSPLPRP